MTNIQSMGHDLTMAMRTNSANLGRDKLPWSQEIWASIDQVVHDEVDRIRTLAKVFIPRPMPNAASVPADQVAIGNLTLGDGTVPFLEISRMFSLTANQVERENEWGTAVTLARMAATSVAMAEEMLLFQGQDAPVPDTVNIQRRESARNGLCRAAADNWVVNPLGDEPGVYGERMFYEIARARQALLEAGQPGPYALFLAPPIFADTYRPLQNTLIAPADRIKPLVTEGFYSSVGLAANTGLLAAHGGQPTSLVISQDTTTSYTQTDEATGMYRFRVFERIQFVVRDPRALRRIEFR